MNKYDENLMQEVEKKKNLVEVVNMVEEIYGEILILVESKTDKLVKKTLNEEDLFDLVDEINEINSEISEKYRKIEELRKIIININNNISKKTKENSPQ